jgi:hypothetical protein
MGRVGADGETGDFNGLTLSNSGPVFLRKPGLFYRQGADRHSPLKVDATAIDNQSTQDNEHNRGEYRPPIIFGAPWLGPPTVVARSRPAFKVSIYHR